MVGRQRVCLGSQGLPIERPRPLGRRLNAAPQFHRVNRLPELPVAQPALATKLFEEAAGGGQSLIATLLLPQ